MSEREMSQSDRKPGERVILVTGGSGGIASTMIETLLSIGDRVVSLDICPPEELPSSSSFRYVKCDVSDPICVNRIILEIIETYNALDAVLNSAAVADYGECMEGPEQGREMEINFWGSVNVIRSTLPHMLSRRRGHIHNLGSILSHSGQMGMCGYLSSKAALAAYVRTLALELKGTGVVVNMFYPPLTRTTLTRGSNMPRGMMANPSLVGRRLAMKVGSSREEVFPDLRTRLQAMFLRSFPRVSARILSRIT